MKFAGWRLFLLSLLCCFIFPAWGVTRVVKNARYENACGEFIEEAVLASNQELPFGVDRFAREASAGKSSLEDLGLTLGYTSALFNSNDERLDLYYEKVIQLNNYYQKIKDNKQILFILAEDDRNRPRIGYASNLSPPEGISIYPHNTFYFWWCVVGIFGLVFGIFGFLSIFAE